MATRNGAAGARYRPSTAKRRPAPREACPTQVGGADRGGRNLPSCLGAPVSLEISPPTAVRLAFARIPCDSLGMVNVQITHDRTGGVLLGYRLATTKPGVSDRLDGYLQRIRGGFLLLVAPPGGTTLKPLFRHRFITKKRAIESFRIFAEPFLTTSTVSRTEKKL
jgi:hypothetical protein